MEEYIHEDMNEEIRSISGYYQYLEEGTLSFNGRDVLYLVGVGVVDNSCCGSGSLPFVRVPGYIVSWKQGTDPAGRPISMVEPITQEPDQRAIRQLIVGMYPGSQVNFQSYQRGCNPSERSEH